METVTIILKSGIAVVKDISFVGIKVQVLDYDNDSKPVIRYYHKDEHGYIKETKRLLL